MRRSIIAQIFVQRREFFLPEDNLVIKVIDISTLCTCWSLCAKFYLWTVFSSNITDFRLLPLENYLKSVFEYCIKQKQNYNRNKAIVKCFAEG